MISAVEADYHRSKIQEENMHYEMQKHSGAYLIVGVKTVRNPHGALVPESIELARSTVGQIIGGMFDVGGQFRRGL